MTLEAAFAHFGRRFDDLSTEITLLEERLTAGPGDARKIKASAAALAETLPSANVLGDLDALAARLTAIAEHADAAAAADRSRRDEHRAAQTARKDALAAEAEELGNNSTQWKVAGDRLRAILDEWKTISGLIGKTDDALWKRYSARRVKRSTGGADRISRSWTGNARAPARSKRSCVSKPKRWSTRRIGAPPALNSASYSSSGRPPVARLATSTTPCGLASRAPRTPSSRPATRRPPTATPNSTRTSPPEEALLSEAEKIDTGNHEAARAALRIIGDKWDAIGKVPRSTPRKLPGSDAPLVRFRSNRPCSHAKDVS